LKRQTGLHKGLIVKLLLAVTFVVCLTAEAFSENKKHKVFVLKSKDISSYNLAVEGFSSYSRKRWDIVEYDLEGELENTPKMLKALDRENPDLVVAVGAKALACLIESKVSRPVVFCMVMNLPEYDFSGLNITGISLEISCDRQFEVLSRLNADIKTVGVLFRKDSAVVLDSANKAASRFNLQLVPLAIENEKEIPPKIRSALGKVDALCMLDDSFIQSKATLEYVVLKSLENNIPFMAISKVFVKEGALVSLSPSFFSNGQQAAEIAEKILVGQVNPKDIPVGLHNNPDLIINLKIAQKMHLDIPPNLLEKAKHVYE
jgi:putative ABC transport system substrate-binding protein